MNNTPSSKPNPNSITIDNEETKTNRNTNLSSSERNYVLSSTSANFRLDGRTNLDHRPYSLSSTSPLLSNGSARLTLPNSTTDVLCSINAELVHPPPRKPDSGIVELNLDVLPYSNATPPSDNTSSSSGNNNKGMEREVSSLLSHLYLPSLIDLKSDEMVVRRGKYVWRLNVDVLVISCDGSLLDVCGMVIWAAMRGLRLPNVTSVLDSSGGDSGNGGGGEKGGKRASEEIILDSDVSRSIRPSGVDTCPLLVTVHLLPRIQIRGRNYETTSTITDGNRGGGRSIVPNVPKRSSSDDVMLVVDAMGQEEACASTKVSVCVDPMGRICGVHKYGGGGGGGGDDGGGTVKFGMLSRIGQVACDTCKGLLEYLHRELNGSDGGDGNDGDGDGVSQLTREYGNLLRGHFELR